MSPRARTWQNAPVRIAAALALLVLGACSAREENGGGMTGAEEDRMGWEIGELVPDVSLEGSDGKTHRLRDLAGERAFVIAWFPKAFTGG